MNPPRKNPTRPLTARAGQAPAAPRQPVVGLEGEFTLLVDGREATPENVFRRPANLLRHHGGPIIPRSGRSCHLPSGGALYFDTGVVEVATALIELEDHGGCARAVRSLWEQIAFVRSQLDRWEVEKSQTICLRGFSAHYNFSLPLSGLAGMKRLHRIARLLPYLIAVPTMLLAANRRSSAVGARPRPGRIEITADFTPDIALTNATLAFLAGVIGEVAQWPDAQLLPERFAARKLPLIVGFRPSRHSSRKGWRAHARDFPANPFTADPNAAEWLLADGRRASLREIAAEVLAVFRRGVRKYADRATYTHLREVFAGQARSLLDFEERPASYDDVGRQIDWGRRRGRALARSAYERVIQRVIAHKPLRIGRSSYLLEHMPGWYEFVFRNVRTGSRRVFNLDELVREAVHTRR